MRARGNKSTGRKLQCRAKPAFVSPRDINHSIKKPTSLSDLPHRPVALLDPENKVLVVWRSIINMFNRRDKEPSSLSRGRSSEKKSSESETEKQEKLIQQNAVAMTNPHRAPLTTMFFSHLAVATCK